MCYFCLFVRSFVCLFVCVFVCLFVLLVFFVRVITLPVGRGGYPSLLLSKGWPSSSPSLKGDRGGHPPPLREADVATFSPSRKRGVATLLLSLEKDGGGHPVRVIILLLIERLPFPPSLKGVAILLSFS